MASDPVSARDEDLRAWRAQYSGATPIGQLVARQRQTCVGVVNRIRIVPGKRLEVTVEDGSGEVTAVFGGRSHLPGLELGTGIRLSGTVAIDERGALSIRNPSWDFVSEPYQ